MNEFADPHVELIAHTTLACDGRSPVIEGRMSLDPDADAEFQQVAGLIREELQKLAPGVFPAP